MNPSHSQASEVLRHGLGGSVVPRHPTYPIPGWGEHVGRRVDAAGAVGQHRPPDGAAWAQLRFASAVPCAAAAAPEARTPSWTLTYPQS